MEAGGSEKTEEEALAGANEEEVGPGTEKVQEEAACIDEAEEEVGPSLENDEESPASDLVEQEDQLAPKVSSPFLIGDLKRCLLSSWMCLLQKRKSEQVHYRGYMHIPLWRNVESKFGTNQ